MAAISGECQSKLILNCFFLCEYHSYLISININEIQKEVYQDEMIWVGMGEKTLRCFSKTETVEAN